MARFLNFLQQASNIRVPPIQLIIDRLLLLKTNDPLQSVDLSHKTLIIHHVRYLMLTAVNPHPHQLGQSLELDSRVVPRDDPQVVLHDHFEEPAQVHRVVLGRGLEGEIGAHFEGCFVLVQSHELGGKEAGHVLFEDGVGLEFAIVLGVDDVEEVNDFV